MIQSINPSNGKLIKEYQSYSNEKVLSVIEQVSDEYSTWKETLFKERSKVLNDIANALSNNIEEHARMISLEIGKPIVESRMEVEKCVWVLQYFADNIDHAERAMKDWLRYLEENG